MEDVLIEELTQTMMLVQAKRLFRAMQEPSTSTNAHSILTSSVAFQYADSL